MILNYYDILSAAGIIPSFMATGLNLSGVIGARVYISLSLKLSMLIIVPAIVTILLALLNSWISIIFLVATFILIIFSYVYLAVIVDELSHNERVVDELLRTKQ